MAKFSDAKKLKIAGLNKELRPILEELAAQTDAHDQASASLEIINSSIHALGIEAEGLTTIIHQARKKIDDLEVQKLIIETQLEAISKLGD